MNLKNRTLCNNCVQLRTNVKHSQTKCETKNKFKMKQIFNFSNKTSSTLRTSLLSKTILTLLAALTFTGNTFAAWTGSGQGVNKSGTWYVLYEDGNENLTKGKTKDYNLSGPGANLSFQAKRERAGTGNLLVTQNSGTTTELYNDNPGKITGYSWGVEKVDYESYSASVNVNSTKITFKNNASITTNTKKYFQYVHVTMAQYLNDPFVPATESYTDLDCGTADILTEATSGQVNVAWCNVPAMSYSITDDENNLFSVSVDVNSEAGKYNTSHFTVTYQHTKAGTHTAKLVITDSYGNYSKTVNLSGTTNKLQPTVTWSTNDEIFIVDDELSASNTTGLTVTLSSEGNESYVNCSGNTATMLAATNAPITITAHVTGNDIYEDADITKDISITNLTKQYITWTQPFSRLKTTDATKSIQLDATSSSGLPVSYELVGDKTGLTLTYSESNKKWTLTYSDIECKNTTIVAKQAGDGTTYAPATSVSLPVKVIDPSKVCGDDETLVNSPVSIKAENFLSSASVTYDIDIPASLTVSFRRMKDKNALGWDVTYLAGVDVKIYSDRDGTGTELDTKEYSADDINKTLSNSTIDLSKYIHAKSVKITTTATNGYYIEGLSYKHQKYCNITKNSLDFETYPNTATSAQTFIVNYANYPITLECSNPKFSFTPSEFGDCSEYGSKEISVKYTAGAEEVEEVGYLYVKDNTGATLQTCTLNVSVSKAAQSIKEHNIGTSYKTTDKITLTAVANSNLTEFEYSATPEGIASFDGNVMTFSKSGTIAITVTQPGTEFYASTSTTIENVVVSAVTPDIAEQPTATLICKGTFANDSLKGGLATVTLRNVADTHVDGHFEWVNANEDVTVEAGTYDYNVTFVPDNNSTDNGMYNDTTFSISVTVNRAQSAIEMNNGSVVAGASLDLSTLIASQTFADHTASYEVISGNADVQANIFTATELGDYTIRATKAQTGFYTEATDEFTVTVVQGKTFNGTKSDEWNNPDKWTGGKPTDNDPVIINKDIAISDTAIIVGGLTIENGKTVTIKNGASLTVGNENSLARANNDHGNIIVENGGKLNLGTGSVEVNNFTIYSGYVAGQTKSGQVLNANMLAVKDSARFILDITAGEIVAEEWYDITVPFPVNALTGVTRYENGEWKSLTYDTHYAFMYYNEEARARGGKGWKWYRGTLKPGVAYSFITDATINRYCFTKTNDGNINTDLTQELQASQGLGENVYRGWNGIGNGTLTYVNLDGTNYVQMFDYEARTYQPVDVSMNTFAVGAAYFVQVTKDSTLTMNIDTEGNNLLRAPQRSAESVASNRFGVKLANNGRKCDNFFVICDEDATDNYTIGTDLMKMGNLTGTKVARMWTNAKGTNLCAIHKAYNGNEAIIPLNIYAPANAEYTLSLDRNTAEDVYLTRNGVIVWDLTMSEYTFDLNAGTDDTYALKVVRRINNTATGIDETTDNDNRGTIFAEKIIVDGQLFILRDGNLYDAQGRKVENR